MKFCFKLLFYFLVVFTITKNSYSKNINSEYVVEVGKIDVGKLFFEFNLSENQYEILITLKDKGIFSGLYSFEGKYITKGKMINNLFVPSHYKQKWKTRKNPQIC